MKKSIFTILVLSGVVLAGNVTCINYGHMIICTDNDTGEQTTILQTSRY